MAEDNEGGRKLRTKERKKYVDQELEDDDIYGKRSYSIEDKLECDKYNANVVQELTGPEFNMEWMQKNGLEKPIIFYDKTGLGLRVPSENFKVSDVKQCVGSRRILDVMDVTTQKALEMSMKDWVKYYENPERTRLLNVISLEFCNTRLENYVESPTLVRQIDWVDRAWPKHLKECQTESTNLIEKMKYPKVQKYCLMSVAGCYTDWHIDFGGTSVWYHILHGEKIFWLAPPSPKNMDKYVDWTLSAKQGDTFLGDTLEQCQRIQLKAGYTFIIPSGWIHAVYTPKDSLVFGGNFLHSFNIAEQLLVSKIENKTYVPGKFRYPFYLEIMWYVVDRYLSCLTGRTYLVPPEKDEPEEDDHGLIQVDEDSRPPSRNPDSRPPSRSMMDENEKGKSENGEETPKLSKSVTIELTRIDAALNRSQSEEENVRPLKTKSRKSSLDPSLGFDGGGPKKVIFFTTRELRGIKQLIDYLTGLLSLPVSKRGIPRDLLNPEAVLTELRQVLDDHMDDDQKLAMGGEPSFGWSESSKKKQKVKMGYKTFKTAKVPKGEKGEKPSGIRRRRTRCKKCEACTRKECGECIFCKDMKKYGGPGRMKQTCISRQCMAPTLPSTSTCIICNQEGKNNPDDPDDYSMQLMECGICWEIVHPACLRNKYENLDNDGNVNEDLPNSWECSKCCNAGKQGQLKPRVKPGVSIRKIKSEDNRSSIDSDGSHEDELTARLSPVEGKRVVSKQEGTVGLKQEFIKSEHFSDSEMKWQPASESKRTTPDGKGSLESKRSTPDVKHSVENKKATPDMKIKQEAGKEESHKKKAYPSSGKEPHRKHIKKDLDSSPQDDTPKSGRKRQTPLSNGKNSNGTPDGTKRPKRETLVEQTYGDIHSLHDSTSSVNGCYQPNQDIHVDKPTSEHEFLKPSCPSSCGQTGQILPAFSLCSLAKDRLTAKLATTSNSVSLKSSQQTYQTAQLMGSLHSHSRDELVETCDYNAVYLLNDHSYCKPFS